MPVHLYRRWYFTNNIINSITSQLYRILSPYVPPDIQTDIVPAISNESITFLLKAFSLAPFLNMNPHLPLSLASP